MQDYFTESIAAVHGLGLRAMLITNFPDQLPALVAAGIEGFGYLPFSEVLPRAALLVYHGGIGTLAQAVRAAFLTWWCRAPTISSTTAGVSTS